MTRTSFHPVSMVATANIQDLLRDCGHRWKLRAFEQTVRVEWSRRLRRSLGRVDLGRRIVRLSAELALAPAPILLEVLCHEAAHIAAKDLHGHCYRPHGEEWAALVRAMGFEPRRRVPWATPSPSTKGLATQSRQYVHRCPVCHIRRTARRPMRQWRCAACTEAGLSGRLEISPVPAPRRA